MRGLITYSMNYVYMHMYVCTWCVHYKDTYWPQYVCYCSSTKVHTSLIYLFAVSTSLFVSWIKAGGTKVCKSSSLVGLDMCMCMKWKGVFWAPHLWGQFVFILDIYINYLRTDKLHLLVLYISMSPCKCILRTIGLSENAHCGTCICLSSMWMLCNN